MDPSACGDIMQEINAYVSKMLGHGYVRNAISDHALSFADLYFVAVHKTEAERACVNPAEHTTEMHTAEGTIPVFVMDRESLDNEIRRMADAAIADRANMPPERAREKYDALLETLSDYQRRFPATAPAHEKP